MKQIVILIVILITVVLGYLSVKSWADDKIRQQIIKVEQQAKSEIEAKKEAARQKAEDVESARLKAQCEAGLKAYQLLTPLQQSKTQKPNCTVQQVQ